jgi:Stage II sporulation protein E (SpoIIE)
MVVRRLTSKRRSGDSAPGAPAVAAPARRQVWTTVRSSAWMAPGPARWWLPAVVIAIGVLSPVAGPEWVPPGAVALPILAGGLLLRRRSLLFVVAVTTFVIGYDEAVLGWRAVRVGQLVVIAATAVFAYRLARTRELLGVQGLRGESMLLELRDRLRAQGEMPELPPGWQNETLIRSAGAGSFGGDFLVAGLTDGGAVLEVALVDVSGKGIDAGTRALLLSGALGGLLGAVAPERFLPAANDYLLRQGWLEGFATAVHLVVDLRTGRYVLESAGHPPAAHFVSGSGTWRVIDSEGTVLGVLPEASYSPVHGVLGPGDAMLLYTDGLVETSEREIAVGIDKLVGEAERLVTQGFRDGASHLIDRVAPDGGDDRALVMIWRD